MFASTSFNFPAIFSACPSSNVTFPALSGKISPTLKFNATCCTAFNTGAAPFVFSAQFFPAS